MYDEGYGVQANEIEAIKWYQLAAHKGFKQGDKDCSWLSKEMTAAQINRVEEIIRQLNEKQ